MAKAVSGFLVVVSWRAATVLMFNGFGVFETQ